MFLTGVCFNNWQGKYHLVNYMKDPSLFYVLDNDGVRLFTGPYTGAVVK